MSEYVINLPDNLLELAKQMALQQHISINGWLIAVITEKLAVASNTLSEERAKRTEKAGCQIVSTNQVPQNLVNIEKQPPKRVFGQHRGKIWISPDFDDPLPDRFWLGEE